MIKVNKGATPAILATQGAAFQDNAVLYANGALYDAAYQANFEKFGKFDSTGLHFQGFSSGLFSEYDFYKHVTVKQQLITEQFGKCVFCEMFIMHGDAGDVEHFKPKSQVSIHDYDVPSERTTVDDHPGYFWCSQTWENLFLSCRQCNGAYKGTLFEVLPPGVRDQPGGAPTEQPGLLYPCDAGLDPREVLRFDPATALAYAIEGGAGNAQTNKARAHYTIKVAGLNRPRLLQARAAHLVKLRSLFVLAANSGGAQKRDDARMDEDNAGVDDGEPDILAFEYTPAEGAGADAVLALRQAIEASAEFSGLARDAITQWNRELKLESRAVQVSLHETNTVRMNTALLRLNIQNELHASLLSAHAVASEIEASPDTRALDERYNTILQQYKLRVGLMYADRTNIAAAQQAMAQINNELEPLRQSLAPLEAQRDDLLLSAEQHNAYLEYHRYSQSGFSGDLWQGYTVIQAGTLRRIHEMPPADRAPLIAKALQWSAGAKAQDDVTLKGLEERISPINQQFSAKLSAREAAGELIDAHDDDLAGLLWDLGGVLGSYQRVGASASQRQARSHALERAMNQFRSWLEDVQTGLDPVSVPGVKPFTIDDHFNGQKWPAKISL